MSPIDKDLHPVIHRGRVAVVTGAASGIGAAAAREFARFVCAWPLFAIHIYIMQALTSGLAFRLGLKVAIADWNEELLDKVAKEITALVGEANVIAVKTDVSKLEDVVALKERVYEAWGEVRSKTYTVHRGQHIGQSCLVVPGELFSFPTSRIYTYSIP